METFTLPDGTTLYNVHPRSACDGGHCCLHSPSPHRMVGFPLDWRGDMKVMERVCPHGIGHPDPDDIAYQATLCEPGEGSWLGVHSCDGCCQPA